MFIFKGLLEKYKLDLYEFKIDFVYVMINNICFVLIYDIKIKNGKFFFFINVCFDVCI